MSKLSTRPDFTNPTIQDTDEFWINVDNLDTTFESQKMTGLQLKTLLTDSVVAGSGTNNYVAKWTPDGATLGNSLIQDDGVTAGIGVNDAGFLFTVSSHLVNYAFRATSSLIGGLGTVAGTFQSLGNGTGPNKGIYVTAANNTNYNVAGHFVASTTDPCALWLQDGTEGSGKVLTCITADGKANWVTPSTPDARVQSVSSSATVTPVSTNDLVIVTAQSVGLTLANPTGTFTEGQALMIRIKDNGTARSIAFDTNYRAIGVTLPTTTAISKTLYLGIIYNSTDTKWDVIGYNIQA